MGQGRQIGDEHCNKLFVPSCHATRLKHNGWNTASLPKPKQEKSRCRNRARTKDLPGKFALLDECSSPIAEEIIQLSVWRRRSGEVQLHFRAFRPKKVLISIEPEYTFRPSSDHNNVQLWRPFGAYLLFHLKGAPALRYCQVVQA
ncbi:hypothetical protein T265_09107 [Opisthorchis viverrini]|uniref:Uncharacterized protein n=1 Tax=Opisthorchis viverrini TaxID=6198 RepID=A0A074ZBE2_OPIVI|nr:hypothetical protein T265_09107 [Opisthorchis viverrini]KER22902.1 hypothetical protein T265_09107 [Opisthorchis viverrini]